MDVHADEEDALPLAGPLHPIPLPAPRWVGAEGEVSQAHALDGNVDHDDASVGNAPTPTAKDGMHVDGLAIVPPVVAHVVPAPDVEHPSDPAPFTDVAPAGLAPFVEKLLAPTLVDSALMTAKDFMASGGLSHNTLPNFASQPYDVPLKVVFQSLYASLFPSKPHMYFCNVSSVSINLDTTIPWYFANSDLLWHLAKVLVDPAPAVVQSPPYAPQSPDVKIIEKMPALKAPRKRRARKVRTPIDS